MKSRWVFLLTLTSLLFVFPLWAASKDGHGTRSHAPAPAHAQPPKSGHGVHGDEQGEESGEEEESHGEAPKTSTHGKKTAGPPPAEHGEEGAEGHGEEATHGEAPSGEADHDEEAGEEGHGEEAAMGEKDSHGAAKDSHGVAKAGSTKSSALAFGAFIGVFIILLVLIFVFS